ncbi:MAG: hypothetical protein JWO67_2880 [Streptosporangiaceae bacterium]|nr:hypothetical protein [Streptosporangiaceae bacterium]
MTAAYAPVRCTIAVLTFRRPDDLSAVLPMLVEQAREVATPALQIDVLVVDNDPVGGGRAVVAPFAGSGVRYVVEPEPGIAAARNRALTEAAESAFLVFIDDDERPHDGWLRSLLDLQARTSAAAVAGAVVSDFAAPLDPFVAAGGFFERRRPPSGTRIRVAASNNLLLDMDVVRTEGLRFDPQFGLSGGSDTLFTRLLAATGATMVWCAEAVVTDHVPPARTSRDWVLRRSFRYGNSGARVDLALARTPAGRLVARLRSVARGLSRVAVGAGRWCVGVLTGSTAHRARGLRTLVRGGGMLAGAFGGVYQEYRRMSQVPG